MGSDSRNPGKFCFAAAQLPCCPGRMWEHGERTIHSSPAVSSTCGLSKEGITSQDMMNWKSQTAFLHGKLQIKCTVNKDLQSLKKKHTHGKRLSVYFLLINLPQPPSRVPVSVWEERLARARDQKAAGKPQDIMEPS